MSKRSKLVYVIVTLLFVFASLAGGAFAAVQMADLNQSDIGFFVNGSLDSPAYSIAGECDAGFSCGSGSG